MNTRLSSIDRTLLRGFGVVGVFTAIVVALLVLPACSVKADVPTSTTAPVVATPVEEAPQAQDNILSFGEVYTWTDEISISVSEPTVFTPSEYSVGLVEGQQAVVVKLVITNGSDAVIDPMVFVSAMSGGMPSASFLDANSPVGDLLAYPSGSLLPGKSVEWLQAYSVVDPADITLEVRPGMRDAEPVIFVNF